MVRFSIEHTLNKSLSIFGVWFLVWVMSIGNLHASQRPNLVVNAADVAKMRVAVTKAGKFQSAFLSKRESVERQIASSMEVPIPKDAGGGYTHERHKKNYQLMYDAGIVYQITQDKKYANYVKNMLLKYAQMYPGLPLHPKRKSKNEGKLFWQGLNEAVWLVHTIQAYDFIYDSLTSEDISNIENGIIRPVALFLSEGSPHTFNRVHNHGTWSNAAVGMTGYVLGEQDWVEKALLDLNKSGKGGFLRQLDDLFSPEGYYNEGPYYQRYALMPFVTFAKAIQANEPERKIFEYRDGIVLKAIDTTIQLSYHRLFFPLNDAIKDKGIDTIELVTGVTIAYGLTKDKSLLDIAQQQDQIVLTGDGLLVADALENGQKQTYQFRSVAYGDGRNGTDGALVVMRQEADPHSSIDLSDGQALVFKATAQGLGHGHFDKLNWLFYDNGEEIISDYGAARFLNIEAKFGGRYLPENKTWAKQTVAHNTLVVDQKSHFNGKTKIGNKHYPDLLFFEQDQQVRIASARIDSAYEGVSFSRTMALVQLPGSKQTLVIDVLDAKSDTTHQYDLPVHYQGQLIETNFERESLTDNLTALGNNNGYQHLWLKAKAKPTGRLNKVTWLNNNGHFYTHSSTNPDGLEYLFTQLGANDPDFNLRSENAFITRTKDSRMHTFVSLLEPHGEYNPSKEYTRDATSNLRELSHEKHKGIDIVFFSFKRGRGFLLAFNANSQGNQLNQFTYNSQSYQFSGHFKLFEVEK